jgi:hypothetical protein
LSSLRRDVRILSVRVSEWFCFVVMLADARAVSEPRPGEATNPR